MASNTVQLPKFLKLRTSDNQVMEVPGHILNESLSIRELYEKNNDNPTEVRIPVEYFPLRKVMKALQLCNPTKPFVMFEQSPENLTKFKTENMQGLKFMDTLSGIDAGEFFETSTILFIPRLLMLYTTFMTELFDDIGVEGVRERYGLRDE